ncbi:MAG: GNAT family N-acetyltransferase [Dehalococcoidia bacterium]|nr:GNAT family N-acetyltransferase [Dehalococcoidia bacterium]
MSDYPKGRSRTDRVAEDALGERVQRIEGGRVVLREKRVADAEHDYAWRCDPDLARLDAAQPLRAPFATFLRRYEEDLQYPCREWHRLGIDTREGRHIGNCVYHNGGGNANEVELGIMIGDPQYRNKGYGADVITTIAGHIFEEPNTDRIYLHTLDWNVRAQKCFRKCGFVPCGEIVRGGHTFIIMELRRRWRRECRAGPVRSSGQEKA